jgi:hypothetical protein
LQVVRQRHHAPAQSTVLVREAASGAIEIRYRGRLMRCSEISAPPPKPRVIPTEAGTGSSPLSRPSGDHPWRRGYLERQQRTAGLAGA